jgi:hypothetical protein
LYNGHRRDSLDILLHAGDISYADGLGERWDSYGRMVEFLTETLPSVVTGGNHEFAGTEEWIHYNTRYVLVCCVQTYTLLSFWRVGSRPGQTRPPP